MHSFPACVGLLSLVRTVYKLEQYSLPDRGTMIDYIYNVTLYNISRRCRSDGNDTDEIAL